MAGLVWPLYGSVTVPTRHCGRGISPQLAHFTATDVLVRARITLDSHLCSIRGPHRRRRPSLYCLAGDGGQFSRSTPDHESVAVANAACVDPACLRPTDRVGISSESGRPSTYNRLGKLSDNHLLATSSSILSYAQQIEHANVTKTSTPHRHLCRRHLCHHRRRR